MNLNKNTFKKSFALLVTVFICVGILGISGVYGLATIGGSSPCYNCHAPNAMSAYSPEAGYASNITVDGNVTDDMGWDDAPKYHKQYIPVSSGITGDEEFMETWFWQSETDLYIYMELYTTGGETNGSDSQFGAADGFAICWNIDSPGFTGRYTSAMNTTHMGGGSIDTMTWKLWANGSGAIADMEASNGGDWQIVANGSTYDMNMDETGWHLETENSWTVGVTLINTSRYGNVYNQYIMEAKRPLTTNDPGDVQFDHTGYYQFAIAGMNGTATAEAGNGSAHHISWGQQLYIYVPSAATPPIPGFEFIIVLGSIGLFIGIVVLLRRRSNTESVNIEKMI